MDVNDLKLELSQEALFMKGLVGELIDIRYDLEYCTACEELYNKIIDIKKLSGDIFDIIEIMKSIKHIA